MAFFVKFWKLWIKPSVFKYKTMNFHLLGLFTLAIHKDWNCNNGNNCNNACAHYPSNWNWDILRGLFFTDVFWFVESEIEKSLISFVFSKRIVVMFFNMLFLYAFMWITNVMKCNEKLWNLMNHHETSWNIVKHQKRHKTQ